MLWNVPEIVHDVFDYLTELPYTDPLFFLGGACEEESTCPDIVCCRSHFGLCAFQALASSGGETSARQILQSSLRRRGPEVRLEHVADIGSADRIGRHP